MRCEESPLRQHRSCFSRNLSQFYLAKELPSDGPIGSSRVFNLCVPKVPERRRKGGSAAGAAARFVRNERSFPGQNMLASGPQIAAEIVLPSDREQ